MNVARLNNATAFIAKTNYMSNTKTLRKLHKEDKDVIINFLDYVRLHHSQPVNVELEIRIRYIAEYVGIDPDQENYKLANAIAKKLEAGKLF